MSLLSDLVRKECGCKCSRSCNSVMDPEFQSLIESVFEAFLNRFGRYPEVVLGVSCFNDFYKRGIGIRSLHLKGQAVDIKFSSPEELDELIRLAFVYRIRVKRICFKEKYIHFGMGSKDLFWEDYFKE